MKKSLNTLNLTLKIYLMKRLNIMSKQLKNSLMKPIVNTLKKQYTLKNPILYEYCVINSIGDFNRQVSSESSEYAKETDQIIVYKLSVDNNYFNSKIIITDDVRIIPIRIEKVASDHDDDCDDDGQLTIDNNNKIKIISIEMNNYCGYLLYETLGNI